MCCKQNAAFVDLRLMSFSAITVASKVLISFHCFSILALSLTVLYCANVKWALKYSQCDNHKFIYFQRNWSPNYPQKIVYTLIGFFVEDFLDIKGKTKLVKLKNLKGKSI